MDASFGTSIGFSLPRSVHRSVMLLSNALQIVGEVKLPLSNPERSRRAKGRSLVLQQYYSAHSTKLKMIRSVQSSTELL